MSLKIRRGHRCFREPAETRPQRRLWRWLTSVLGVAIVDVIQAWLLLVAPASPTPKEPLCYLLSDGSHQWSFGFDGTRWTSDPCTGYGRTVTAQGTPERLALALAGRRPIQQAVDESSDPAAIAKLKTYLPGP